LEGQTTPSQETTDAIEAGKPQNAGSERQVRPEEPSTLTEDHDIVLWRRGRRPALKAFDQTPLEVHLVTDKEEGDL